MKMGVSTPSPNRSVKVMFSAASVSAVCITYASFIWFRADTFAHAVECYGRVPEQWSVLVRPGELYWELFELGLDFWMLGLLLILIPICELVEYGFRHAKELRTPPAWLRWLGDYALIFGVLILGKFSREAFVYFQF